jgi:octaprenyl-diphosphate synthase
LGLCFQIVDDWLDYSGEAAALGKPVLSDVREGRITLPLLLALARSDDRDRGTLVDLIRKCGGRGRGLPKILDIVRRKDALQDTLRRAQAYAAEAKAALEGLPASEERSALLTLTDRLLQRNT